MVAAAAVPLLVLVLVLAFVLVPGSVAVVATLVSVEDDDPVVVEAELVASESAPVVLVSEVSLLLVVVLPVVLPVVVPLVLVLLAVEPGRSFEVDVVVSTLLLGADEAVAATATVLVAAWTVEVGSADPPPPQAVSAAVTSAAPRRALARKELEDEYMAHFS